MASWSLFGSMSIFNNRFSIACKYIGKRLNHLSGVSLTNSLLIKPSSWLLISAIDASQRGFNLPLTCLATF